MSLKALVLCSDEKIVRVLRRTLGDLEISVDLCTNADSALRKLTRDRFEAIIVDCAGPRSAEVLLSARRAPCNKRAVAVAIVEPLVGLRSAFDIGAHFVLYKPVSTERAKSSFRAARALMKRERRRNSRIPILIPVTLSNPTTGVDLKVSTLDLSEGGMAIKFPRGTRPAGRWNIAFSLPASETRLELGAEFAWEGTGAQAGLRFMEMTPETSRQLCSWISRNASDAEKADPPEQCQLSDLSLGGCYLEISSPFPVSTRVTLSMRAAHAELRAEGIVRVMHPDTGMGVEFTQATPEHRRALEKFLDVLSENRGLLPELLVEPEGLETESAASAPEQASSGENEDPLLELFRSQAGLSTESFREELRKQRHAEPPKSATAKA
jgi:c-di-GMP-binding flagellar brake protein YcgR